MATPGFGATSFLDKRSTVGYSITPNPDLISVRSGVLMPGARHLLGCPPTHTGLVNILKCILLEWGNGLYQALESGLSGLTPFPPVYGHLQKFYVSFQHRDVSLCVRPHWWSLICRRNFLLARRILQSPSENCSLEECWFWYKPLNLSRWLFSTRSPDILTSAQMRRWVNPAELHFVCALSKMNCRADKFFTPCPCQLCKLQILSKLKWEVLDCHSIIASVSWETGCNKPRHVPELLPSLGGGMPAMLLHGQHWDAFFSYLQFEARENCCSALLEVGGRACPLWIAGQ